MNTQLVNIKKKANFLFVKLYPYLVNASAEGRRDMWKTMVTPLFEPVLLMCRFETAQTEVRKLNLLLLSTFKRYLIIPKNTNTDLVLEMIGDQYEDIATRKKYNAAEKWFARRENREPELMGKVKTTNYLRGIPNSWCDILKQQCKLCFICKNSNRNDQHMWNNHKIIIVSYKTIWEEIKMYHDSEVEKHKKKKTIMKLKRGVFLKHWHPILKSLKEETGEKFDKIYDIKKDYHRV